MGELKRWRTGVAGLMAGWALLACGGGGSDSAVPPPVSTLPQEPGAPVQLNNISVDGLNWINYRRAQVGMPTVTRNSLIDRAAQGHSDYQKANSVVSHDQIAGKPSFTGIKLLDRLTGAGYSLGTTGYAYGEVISAANSSSGFYMAEELITAIFHRFVIFEPKFKEIGTGSATSNAGYTYFTSDFAASNGYGPGIGRGKIVNWPYDGQVKVATNFFSDNEAPDPVPNVNEVGYPVSVHADINVVLGVTSFTIRPRNGSNLQVQLLKSTAGSATPPPSAAAIVPLSVLKANTVYDVTFNGTTDGVPITRSWSFTTK
jgi:uncharacterized protein YkwD